MKSAYNLPCNIAQTLNLIGEKWSLLIIHELAVGHHTYKEIQNALIGIPTNLLAARLKELEVDGLLISRLYQEHPPRCQYELTESGNALCQVLDALILWGEQYLPPDKRYKRLVHKACGHCVEQRYYCPHCGQTIDKTELLVMDQAGS